jgi:hypothetical protein
MGARGTYGRQTLADLPGAAPLLLTTQQTIQVNPAGAFTLDVTQFVELLTASARCGHRTLGDCPGCVEHYSRAAALDDALLAYAMNGQDLPIAHGGRCGWWCRAGVVSTG